MKKKLIMIYLLSIAITLIFQCSLYVQPSFSDGTSLNHMLVSAQEKTYGIIGDSNVYLYPDDKRTTETDIICALPKSYYVEIDNINDGSDYYLVTYGGAEDNYCRIPGAVKKNGITIQAPTEKPYFFKKQLELSRDTTVFKTPDKNDTTSAISITDKYQIMYYGSFQSKSGDLWYYVNVSSRFGYILSTAVKPFEITTHPDQARPQLPTDPEITTPDPPKTEIIDKPKTNDNMTVFLIIAICIPAIIIIVLLFRGNGNNRYQNRDNHKNYSKHEQYSHRYDNYPNNNNDNYRDD